MDAMTTVNPHSPIPRRIRAAQAFTLVEALTASVILMLALGSILALASRGFRYMSDTRRWARSSQILQEEMEKVRLITVWTNMWALNNTTFTNSAIPGLTYRGTRQLAAFSSNYPSTMVARVTLSITWTNTSQLPVTNRLTTVVCQNGLNKYIF
jgi:Tfp pilus assembly protein PilV